jgi:vacuolar-type H+-ATPase subunit I/STV1
MENFQTEFKGRTFVENPQYQRLERFPVSYSKNKIFCITVEKCLEIPRDRPSPKKQQKLFKPKTVTRIVRWRARNDKENPNIKYWRILRSYNIRSIEEWENAESYVNRLIGGDQSDPSHITIPIQEYTSLIEEKKVKDNLESEIEKIKTLEKSRKAETDIFKKKIKLMKASKKKFEGILNTFKELIENPKSNETKIHKFIHEERPYWLFGLEYIHMASKVSFPPNKKDYEFDLMLQRYDNFFDLVELKGPNEKLFRQKTKNRYQPGTKLAEALGQVFKYIHICDTTPSIKDLLKPKAFIVIGNENTDDANERRIFSSFLNNVEVLTYTDLLTRGKKLLEYIDTLNVE